MRSIRQWSLDVIEAATENIILIIIAGFCLGVVSWYLGIELNEAFFAQSISEITIKEAAFFLGAWLIIKSLF